MYHKSTGSYDEIPDGMKYYINNYGCHFNKKLSDEAARRMYREVNGRKEHIEPYTKEYVDKLLENNGITLDRGRLYDHVYVANMCQADFLGKSIPNDSYMCKYIKDVIDDADAEDGYIFNRFYADCMFMDNPIDWEEMV